MSHLYQADSVAYPADDRNTVWLQTARGSPADVLAVKEDAPIPKPAPHEVLVKGALVSVEP